MIVFLERLQQLQEPVAHLDQAKWAAVLQQLAANYPFSTTGNAEIL